MKSFQQTQLAFAQYLRDPDAAPAPVAIEDRRMGIYRDLVYNNIESLIATVFPVLRSLHSSERWHAMVRDFIRLHRCHTPYFLEISEEFLQFLTQEYQPPNNDFPFLCELAHYEWLELALDVSDLELPPSNEIPQDILGAQFNLSPLAVYSTYQYPVHKISPQFKPCDPEPAYLVVYRNRADKVRFMAVNSLTLRLLYLMQSNAVAPLGEHLDIICSELQHPDPEQFRREAKVLITELHNLDIVIFRV